MKTVRPRWFNAFHRRVSGVRPKTRKLQVDEGFGDGFGEGVVVEGGGGGGYGGCGGGGGGCDEGLAGVDEGEEGGDGEKGDGGDEAVEAGGGALFLDVGVEEDELCAAIVDGVLHLYVCLCVCKCVL
ncbi:hypothetical protein L1987_71609 [Smallanthus sonchifolius]|uniref:Uncharacterized protein n=1 Tax=Smallanthus sonchifolius TaxID=185202 RepID=A0ACB9AS21_9ASTR|nr:hypothetical protein L1987_71609 [Smallanthus sonchifolius]